MPRTATSRVRQVLRSALSKLRHTRDVLLHPRRHQRAKARLRAARPRSIVVVCHGNICRSPFLEAVLRRDLPGVAISSAGLIGPGRSVPEHGLTVAARGGLDLSGHRSRLLGAEILHRADMVIVMDARQARYVIESLRFPAERVWVAGDLDATTRAPRAIRDPWDEPIDVFQASYARLEQCAATIVRVLSDVPADRTPTKD